MKPSANLRGFPQPRRFCIKNIQSLKNLQGSGKPWRFSRETAVSQPPGFSSTPEVCIKEYLVSPCAPESEKPPRFRKTLEVLT